jgi:hypothetical protein
MKEYLLLFRGGNREDLDSPEKVQQMMAKWRTWMENLGKQGRLGAAQPLEPTGKLLKGSKRQVTDGPFAEGKEFVGGFLVLKASNYDEAIHLSKDCPILEREGLVEVREVQEMAM